MRDRLDELPDRVDLVLITFTTADELAAYQDDHHLPFPILIDHDRSAYRAYGLGRGSFTDVWGWDTVKRYASILVRDGSGSGAGGRLGELRPATEDTRQLGGDFVIAPDGRLAWGYWSTGPPDRPSVEEIVAASRTALAGGRG